MVTEVSKESAGGLMKKDELLVERQNKEVVKVSAGEVSVRGLYSYV